MTKLEWLDSKCAHAFSQATCQGQEIASNVLSIWIPTTCWELRRILPLAGLSYYGHWGNEMAFQRFLSVFFSPQREREILKTSKYVCFLYQAATNFDQLYASGREKGNFKLRSTVNVYHTAIALLCVGQACFRKEQ